MILLLFEYPTLCGGEQSLLSLLPTLRGLGCRLTAAAPPQGPLAEALRQHGVEVVPLSLHDENGARLPLAQCRVELAAILQRCQPEMLHANSLSMARLSGPVASDGGVPSVGHLRDILRLSRQAVDDVNRHPWLLAVSEAVASYHRAQGIDASRTCVLYNGVDLQRFRPQPSTGYLHRELNLDPRAKLIGAIGQIGPRKGLDLLLTAGIEVLHHRQDAHFLLVGERLSRKAESAQFESGLRALAATFPLTGHVHFLGWRCDVAELLRELTLLVHPARQEPLGRVLLEGAATGCTIVAFDVGGTSEIFRQPDPAVTLLPTLDSKSLATAMLTALDKPPTTDSKHRTQVVCSVEDTALRLYQHWANTQKSGYRARTSTPG